MNENNSMPLPEEEQLAPWPNAPDVKTLKQDFLSAQMAQRPHVTKIREWRDLLNVSGSARPKRVTGRSSVQPKLIRRQAEWRYSALTEPFLSSNKMFKVTPVSWEDLDSARQNELVLNWQFRTKFNQVKFVDEFVRTTVNEGTSIVRLGWEREVVMIDTEVPVLEYYEISSEEEAQAFEQALQLKTENPNEYENLPLSIRKSIEYYEETGTPVVAVENGEMQVIQQERILVNQPTLDFVNPENIYIDPTAQGVLSKARFIIMSFETSKADLKKDPRYRNLDLVNFDAAGVLSAPDHETTTPNSFQFDDAPRKRIVAYEYWGLWDINGDEKLVPIVATWVGDVLIRLEENPFPDQKAPFVIVPYLPMIRSMFGETDAELLEDNQKILGAVTRGMIDIMARSANGQTGIQKGMLDAVNRRRFDNGQDYEFNPAQNPLQGLIEHKYPEISQSAPLMIQMQNQEAEALTGVKAFSGGMSGNAYGDVAAGIRGMLDAASKREMAILRRLAQGMKEIGSKIIMMNQEFLSEKEVVRVTNEEFVTVRREDLGGFFDLEVDISTAEVDNAKSQDLAFMLQTIGPNLDLGMQKLILSQIADLKRMPTLAHQLRNYEPQPDPLDVELKQLEVEKMRMEVEELRTQAQLNQSKAKEADTKSDLNNLNFVEQETGTKHERDLQKQGAQAKANQDLEVTKALLGKHKEGEKPGNVAAAIGYNRMTDNDTPREGRNFTGRNYAQPRQVLAGREFDGQGNENPVTNLNSKYHDPAQDPALNSAMNLGR